MSTIRACSSVMASETPHSRFMGMVIIENPRQERFEVPSSLRFLQHKCADLALPVLNTWLHSLHINLKYNVLL